MLQFPLCLYAAIPPTLARKGSLRPFRRHDTPPPDSSDGETFSGGVKEVEVVKELRQMSVSPAGREG